MLYIYILRKKHICTYLEVKSEANYLIKPRKNSTSKNMHHARILIVNKETATETHQFTHLQAIKRLSTTNKTMQKIRLTIEHAFDKHTNYDGFDPLKSQDHINPKKHITTNRYICDYPLSEATRSDMANMHIHHNHPSTEINLNYNDLLLQTAQCELDFKISSITRPQGSKSLPTPNSNSIICIFSKSKLMSESSIGSEATGMVYLLKDMI